MILTIFFYYTVYFHVVQNVMHYYISSRSINNFKVKVKVIFEIYLGMVVLFCDGCL